MEELKEKLIDQLITQIELDIYSGDKTVLAELLNFIPNRNLIEALPEEDWKDYSPLIS